MIQELHAGDRQIPASGWNEMRAAVQGMTPGQQQYQSAARNPVYITIKNVTGADLPAFSVVKITGHTYERYYNTGAEEAALNNGVEVDGDMPGSSTDTIAVIQEACPTGGFAKAIMSGATPVRASYSGASSEQYGAIVPGYNYLLATDKRTNIKLIPFPHADTTIGYAIIDYIDDRERFLITCTASNNYASIAKKARRLKYPEAQTAGRYRLTTMRLLSML